MISSEQYHKLKYEVSSKRCKLCKCVMIKHTEDRYLDGIIKRETDDMIYLCTNCTYAERLKDDGKT